MSTKAEVETLTAEVKTLVVGNRQITLSVARQLDEVHIRKMSHVFGRIQITNRKPTDRDVLRGNVGYYVIGKHRDNGSLVTSNLAAHRFGEVDWGWAYNLPKIILAGLK